jgi:hypothetical protein
VRGHGDTDWSNEDRSHLLAEASGSLVTIGFASVRNARRTGNRSALATGIAIQTAGDLSRGVHKLIGDANFYSAVTLARQVLETTQLIQYFQLSPDRAEFWLTASDSDMRKAVDFKPASLRRSTQSSDHMYGTHCFLGGHPRAVARHLLPGSPWRRTGDVIEVATPDGVEVSADLKALLLTDTLQHVYEAVTTAIEALDIEAIAALGPLEKTVTQRITELVQDLVRWRDQDPLARVGTIGV